MTRHHRSPPWPLIALGVLLLLGDVRELPIEMSVTTAHAEAGNTIVTAIPSTLARVRR